MSEKRLIDIDELIVIAFNAESSNDIEEEFKKLPKPILPDVCGNRTLDSMTEEEILDLFKTVGIDKIEYIRRLDWAPRFLSATIKYKDGGVDIFHIEMGLVLYSLKCPIKVIESVKWFLDHGFNVFGEKK